MGGSPVYDITISESGNVTWKGLKAVKSLGLIHSKIKSEAAHALILKFLNSRIWFLDDFHSRGILDVPGTILHLQIGGQARIIRNNDDSAPEWVQQLEYEIDDTANTHRWRHGDPRSEPLINIAEDGMMPKPGVTPLMKAIVRKDLDAMRLELAKGDAVEAADSSGWTALMYAAAKCDKPVQILLSAKANPNHKSFLGYTPLMAAAVTGEFCEDLVQAGAQINAQNSTGITSLMILAAKGDAFIVEEALNAGADPLLRDAKGRSAIDHLRLSYRGKSPIFPSQDPDFGMDDEEFKEIETLLKAVKRNK
jgi:hypothetical protein